VKKNRVRAIAICVFHNGDRILVAEGFDELKNQKFYRPLGGTIEFGEYSDETVRRELMEEIQVEVSDLRYLGTLENIFTFNGKKGHEIVFIYDGKLIDAALYEKDILQGDELGTPFQAIWLDLRTIGPGSPPLYPTGLTELLNESRRIPRQF
jgi:8-oxo-dGTP pyrophosphatase MutT (NUDIX family)